MVNVVTVSYTHLDVYKRQGKNERGVKTKQKNKKQTKEGGNCHYSGEFVVRPPSIQVRAALVTPRGEIHQLGCVVF